MEALSKALLTIHVVCGFLSLIVFWVPIFVKKGGDIHRKIGKLYLILMWVVVISAGILSIENFTQGHYVSAAFLGFLVLITSNPLWYGIAILKHKKGISQNYKNMHMFFNLLIVIAGVLLLFYGIYLKNDPSGILMIIFGILGISTGRDIFIMYRYPVEKSNWINEHISGMLISGIAAYTAFAVFGGMNFLGEIFSGYFSIIPWVAPTIIGTAIIKYYKKSYLDKRQVTRD